MRGGCLKYIVTYTLNNAGAPCPDGVPCAVWMHRMWFIPKSQASFLSTTLLIVIYIVLVILLW